MSFVFACALAPWGSSQNATSTSSLSRWVQTAARNQAIEETNTFFVLNKPLGGMLSAALSIELRIGSKLMFDLPTSVQWKLLYDTQKQPNQAY